MRQGFMGMWSSRQIMMIAGIGLLLLIGIIAAVSLSLSNDQSESDTTTLSTFQKQLIDKKTKRVFIKDFFTYGVYFPVEKQQSIENVLYTYVSKSDATPDLYTGIVRPKSFSQTKNSDGKLMTMMLVDIHPADVTYTLETAGKDKYGMQPVIIRCSPKAQQKNPAVTCLDGTKDHE